MAYFRPSKPSPDTGNEPRPSANIGLISDDWRSTAPVPERAARKEPSAEAPNLYLRSRPGAMDKEIARAREVVNQARVLIEETFAKVAQGEPIETIRFNSIMEGVLASVHRNPNAILSVVQLKQLHEYTYLHSVAVCALMIGFARELKLDRATTLQLGMAGMLHDIGKARIPKEMLEKPTALSAQEWVLMKQHCTLGHEILSDIGGLPQIALDVSLHHHERMDGSGYPMGLKGDALSLPVRMSMICDVFDAVTTKRTYNTKWTPARAIDWMRSRPEHFDQSLMQSFARLFGPFPAGSLVRLRSDRLAMVREGQGPDPLSPPVITFQCALSGQSLPWRSFSSREDPIVSVESPANWGLVDWPSISGRMMTELARG